MVTPWQLLQGWDRYRQAAARVYLTGSFWCGAVAMAAAVATIRKLSTTNAIAKMAAMGQRLRDGLTAQSQTYGFSLRQTGPAQMPQILFDGDADFALGNRFVVEAMKRGVSYASLAQHVSVCCPHRGRHRRYPRSDRRRVSRHA